MDFTGAINNISLDYSTHKPIVSLRLDQNATEDIESLVNEDCLDIRIKKHRNKRSLDANAYYWTLIAKLASVVELSNAECHNQMLRLYGEYERINGSLVATLIPDTDEASETVLRKEEYHLCPTSKVVQGAKDVNYRTYVLMRGSSTYDTKEMARLIQGLINECKNANIPDSEIMTPFEKEKLKEVYGIG